jgi:hypothetical protein
MKYFILSPEVAGHLGEHTIMNRTVHPPKVSRLHYELDGWLGDELLETFPCFVLTRELADALRDAELTGLGFGEVEVTTSAQFKELYPERSVPSFVWLRPTGESAKHDLALDKDARLVVSERALDIFRSRNLENCDLMGCE